ncbi:uncharacterized protein BO95DRAFT_428234 [Aspergillus brunneoviolaceus CBS 621.78]|uniref:Uncharacterized protein n=1 Tax=Aspergillus brunneoviolaceus CBS 621.78 TaxID=1450534 RepID=A0ACD1GL22_9EURO|nr:hypothetical protein BO95DRAFT_428234 [Aspergillus brunneoviolaceus CBS 621.78]RAH49885.1 hypothetical protein BO95DRAFT_428234 [Aspergillus brunneoviolaceus CBS 621.78]
MSAAPMDVEEQRLPGILVYEVRIYPRPLRVRNDVDEKWASRCTIYTLTVLCLFMVFFNLATYYQDKRDHNINNEDNDRCSNQHDTALGLACILGLLGADHWYAHRWLLAVLKSMWAFLEAGRFLIYRYGGKYDPHSAGTPPGLFWLSTISFLMMIVTIFWWPIDAMLWGTGVYSTPGCMGPIGIREISKAHRPWGLDDLGNLLPWFDCSFHCCKVLFLCSRTSELSWDNPLILGTE